jgi:hypothetical protein
MPGVTEMNTRQEIPETEMFRSSGEIEAAVNRGLMSAMFSGVAAGAAVMREGGVPLHVSARVLINPAHRRASDWRSVVASLPGGR